jgi:hypothetical protein
MQTKSFLIPSAVAMFLSLAACDTKVSQCNKLIDVVNKHTTTLSSSIEKLADVQNNPTVADDFAKVVKTANDEIAALSFSDEKISGFAKDYQNLLAEADKVGKSMADAAKTANVDTLNKAVADADKLVKMEETIVNNVNGYCQGK